MRKPALKPSMGDAKVTEFSFKISVDPTDGSPNFYCNYAEVAHSQNEFCLLFARVPTKLPHQKLIQVKEHKLLSVEPEVQVLIPMTMIDGLIKALTKQKLRYEKKFGVDLTKGADNDK